MKPCRRPLALRVVTALFASPQRSLVSSLGIVCAGAVSAVALGIITRLFLPEMVSCIAPLLSFVLGMILAGCLLEAQRKPEGQAEGSKQRLTGRDASKASRDAVEIKPQPFASGEGQPGNIIAFQAKHQRDPRIERILSELGHYPVFTDILSKQMKSVTGISEAAAKGILDNLTEIDNQITSLLGFIQQSGSNDQAARVVAEIEKQTQECRDLLDRFRSEQEAGVQRGRSQRSQIASETRKVMDVLDGVNGVARQTTMLSLNVSIEAARAGEVGRGFAIIGEEIRKLASEVQGLAKEVRDRVETLTRIVTLDLQQEAEKRDQTERTAIANIGGTLNAMTDNLLTLMTHQRDILFKVESENESIARPILQMMGSIQFQDIIRQQLEQLVRMAGMVNDHIQSFENLLSDPDAEPQTETLSEKLDNLFESYVMDSQRESHRAVQGQTLAQAGCAKIELF